MNAHATPTEDHPIRSLPTPVLDAQERALVALLLGGHTLVQASRCLSMRPAGARILLAKVDERAGCSGRSDLVELARWLGIDPISPEASCR